MSQETLRPLSVDHKNWRDLERRRVMNRMLYWAQRFDHITDDWQLQLSRKQQSDWLKAEQHRLEQIQRWQDLCYLRWAMQEEQRKYIEKHGNDALGISIWDILAAEQKELEEQLVLHELQEGSFHSFATVMNNPTASPSSQPPPGWRQSKGWHKAMHQTGIGFVSSEGYGEDSFYGGTINTEFDSENEVETINLLPDQTQQLSKRNYVEFDDKKDRINHKLDNIKQSIARSNWLMQQIFEPYLKMSAHPGRQRELESRNWKEQPVQQERMMIFEQAVDEQLKMSFELEQELRMKGLEQEQLELRRSLEKGRPVPQERERRFDSKLERERSFASKQKRRSFDLRHPEQKERTGSFDPKLERKRNFELEQQLKERNFDPEKKRSFQRGFPVKQEQKRSFAQEYPVQNDRASNNESQESGYGLERKRGYMLEFPKEVEKQRSYDRMKKSDHDPKFSEEPEMKRTSDIKWKNNIEVDFNYQNGNRNFHGISEAHETRSFELDFLDELEEKRSFELDFIEEQEGNKSFDLDLALDEQYANYSHSSTPEDCAFDD